MSYFRIQAVPHFIVRTPGEEDEVRRNVLQEYRELLRFFLQSQGELTLHFTTRDGPDGGPREVEVGYELARDEADVREYVASLRRYLRLEPAASPPVADGPAQTVRRRVHLAAVGAVGKAVSGRLSILPVDARRYQDFDPSVMGQASMTQVLLNPLVQLTARVVRDRFTPGEAHLMPVPAELRLAPGTERWRNTLGVLLQGGGRLTMTCRRHAYEQHDAAYALLCLQYYLGTNVDKLAAEEIDRNTAVLRALFLKQPVYTLEVAFTGSALTFDSFLRDTDPDAFEQAPTVLEASLKDAARVAAMARIVTESRGELVGPGARFDGLARDSNHAPRPLVENHPAARYGQYFLGDELVELILPPFTFRDALPGLPHFVPKPFQEPYVPAGRNRDRSVTVGRTDTGRALDLPVVDFTRHVFITGASGAGKTNTMMALVSQLHSHGCPVLIIDPVKRDFEPLMESLGLRSRIFDFRHRWLRFNPFIPPPNVTLYAHSVVLAKTLAMMFPTNAVAHEILLSMVKHTYWRKIEEHRRADHPMTTADFVQKTGRDLRDHPFLAPTFDEFLDLGMEVLRGSADGPASQWTRDAIEHFERRWENLRRSALSLMLNPTGDRRWQVIDDLFSSTTLLEFGAWFDQSEANAAFALIFSMMYEQRLSECEDGARRSNLPAVALLDEAHRIVPAHTARGDDSLVSAGGETAQLLTQMIAECRALGQGLILAEQSASKIDPNVLINTSTKVVHTVLYGQDKEYLSSALSLSDAERDYLAYLPVGEALAFTPTSYQPMHVRVPEFGAA